MMNIRAFGLLVSSLAAVMFLSPEPNLRRVSNNEIIVVEAAAAAAAAPVDSARRATEDLMQTATGAAQRTGEEIRQLGEMAYEKFKKEEQEQDGKMHRVKEKLQEAAQYQPNLGQGVGYYDQAYGIAGAAGSDHAHAHEHSRNVEDYLEGARASAKDAMQQASEGLGLLRRERSVVPPTVESARSSVGEYYDATRDTVVQAITRKEQELGTSLSHAKGTVERYYEKAKEMSVASVENQKEALEQYLDLVVHKLNAGREAVLQYALHGVQDVVNHGKASVHRGKEAVNKGKDAVVNYASDSVEAVNRGKDAVVNYAADSINHGKEAVNKGKDAVVNYATDSINHGKEAVNRGKDAVVDGVSHGRDVVVDGVTHGRDAVVDTFNQGKEAVSHGKDVVVEEAKRGVDSIQKKVQGVEDEAAKWGSNAKGKIDETLKGAGRWAHGKMVKLNETEEMALTVCRKWVQNSVNSVVRLAHLFIFSTVYGSAFWVTFVSGFALARSVTRHQFGSVQSKIFPVYFRVLASGLALLLATHMILHPFPKADLSELLQYQNLAACLAFTLLNAFVLEPQATKQMFEQLKLEKDEAKAADLGPAATPDPDDERPNQMHTSSKKLNKLHSFSATANFIVLVGLTWHLWYLNCRLVM